MSPEKLETIIALTVTAVWAASFFADAALTTYDPGEAIHGIMMVVVGAYFARKQLSSKKEREHDWRRD